MNLDSITLQQKSHENFNSKINFRFTLKLPEVMRTSAFINKKIRNLHLNSESLNELKNSETEVSLKQYLDTPRFIEETIYSGNLHHLPLRMLKVFLFLVFLISTEIFLRQAIIVADIFHKLVAPLPLYQLEH